MADILGLVLIPAVIVVIILYLIYRAYTQYKKWEDIFYGEASLTLARLQEEGFHVRVAEILTLALWRMDISRPLRELLESYAEKSIEEVYRKYKLPRY